MEWKKLRFFMDECTPRIFSYYANKLDRHPDEQGILDTDVSFDGKNHSFYIILCFILMFWLIYYKYSIYFEIITWFWWEAYCQFGLKSWLRQPRLHYFSWVMVCLWSPVHILWIMPIAVMQGCQKQRVNFEMHFLGFFFWLR